MRARTQDGRLMVSPEKAAKRNATHADGDIPRKASEWCLFCHRPADMVTFVVRDREHGYNVCTDCLDDCARTVACSCVC
jgi:hypothetical protein